MKEKKAALSLDNGLGIKLSFLSENTLILLLILIALIYLLLLNKNLSPFVDNARYLTAAKSLLQGSGYSRIHAPVVTPQTLYPPGYPLLLAGLMYLFSFNIILFKIFSVLALVFGLFFLFLLLRRYVDFTAAAVITVVTGLSPLLVRYSAVELTEPLFLAVAILGLLLIEKSTDLPGLNKYFFTGILVAISAYYIKSAGIIFLLVGLVYYIYKKDYKKAAVFTLIFILLMSPWFIRSLLIEAPENGTYFKQIVWKNPYNTSLGKATFLDIAERTLLNLLKYATFGLRKFSLGNLLAKPLSEQLFRVAALMFSLITLIGFADRVRKGIKAADIFAFGYLGMYLLWPAMDIRYMHALMPFFIYYFLFGARFVGLRLASIFSKPVLNQAVVAILLVPLVLLSLLADVSLVLANLKQGGLNSQQTHFYQANNWLKDNSAQNSIILSARTEATFILSGRKAANYQAQKASDLIKRLETSTYDYLLVDAFSYTFKSRKIVNTAIKQNKERFKLIYATKQPVVKVYKILRNGDTPP